MPIGKNSKGEWVGGGRSHDHPPPLPPSATDAERQERGGPEACGEGWMDRPTPTLAEAFEHVQRLSPEGDRETELALGIISEALKAGAQAEMEQRTAHATSGSATALTAFAHVQRLEEELRTSRREADQLAQRIGHLAETRAMEAREAVRNMAAHGRDCRATGHAEATEGAARWLEEDVLGPGNMSEWSRMPPYLHGRIRAGEHLAEHVGQDPAKEPV